MKESASVSGAEVRLLTVDQVSADDLTWADALIVGSPVHSANIAAPVAEFLSSLPFDGRMKDKVGAAFVTAGGISAGEEAVQLSILRAMMIYNMIIVGGPEWTGAFGASGVTGEEPFTDTRDEPWVDPIFVAKAEALGVRVTQVARRMGSGGQRDPVHSW